MREILFRLSAMLHYILFSSSSIWFVMKCVVCLSNATSHWAKIETSSDLLQMTFMFLDDAIFVVFILVPLFTRCDECWTNFTHWTTRRIFIRSMSHRIEQHSIVRTFRIQHYYIWNVSMRRCIRNNCRKTISNDVTLLLAVRSNNVQDMIAIVQHTVQTLGGFNIARTNRADVSAGIVFDALSTRSFLRRRRRWLTCRRWWPMMDDVGSASDGRLRAANGTTASRSGRTRWHWRHTTTKQRQVQRARIQ
jgi:hypothetical protein